VSETLAAETPVLTIRNLEVSFGTQPAVRNISLEVRAGETLALVGESGSGKSVTALSVMRLLPASARLSGGIFLSGTDMLALRGDALRAARGKLAGMIFQEPMASLNPVLRTGFQVAESLQYHFAMSRREAEAEALRLFDRVRIPNAKRRFNDYPHTLSGGMRQRVMIAMALACRPRLLIADEPTTALDVTVQAQILDLLAEIQRESGTAILFITHDIGVVARISHRIAVAQHGAIVEMGLTADILKAPQHDYSRMLLAAVPRLGDMSGSDTPRRFAEAPKSETQLAMQPIRMAPSPDLLIVDGLVTRFPLRGAFGRVTGQIHSVEDVSFRVGAGETLALVGESGCGKSTTGKSLLRLVEPQAGRVVFDGSDVLGSDAGVLRTVRRRMQMIFQDPYGSLDPRQTVGSAIVEPIRVHGLAHKNEAWERMVDLLERVGLDPACATRFPHEFSGGQRQRIAIARALALDPMLIIADEPLSALDASIKAQIVDLMIDLQETYGLSYLFISHDMAVVERLSHRIAVMRAGRIVEIGPRAAVIENPQHPYTRALLAAVPVINSNSHDRLTGAVAAEELKNPFHPLDYVPPQQHYREATPGHFIAEEV
jgi:peptide/nickel transport system ATP-binding protein